MSMTVKERENLIDHLDKIKELVKIGKVDAIVMGYKIANHTGTALLGNELELFGLSGVINASILKQDMQRERGQMMEGFLGMIAGGSNSNDD